MTITEPGAHAPSLPAFLLVDLLGIYRPPGLSKCLECLDVPIDDVGNAVRLPVHRYGGKNGCNKAFQLCCLTRFMFRNVTYSLVCGNSYGSRSVGLGSPSPALSTPLFPWINLQAGRDRTQDIRRESGERVVAGAHDDDAVARTRFGD